VLTSSRCRASGRGSCGRCLTTSIWLAKSGSGRMCRLWGFTDAAGLSSPNLAPIRASRFRVVDFRSESEVEKKPEPRYKRVG
jgi:hypothetical protein